MSSAINEDGIQALIKNFSSVGKNVDVVKTRTTPDFRFIRPSGNPLDAAGFANMFASGDLVMQSIGLSKVHRLDVYGDRAFAAFTQVATFTYKGVPNDDVFTVTALFQKIDGLWYFSWVQRSSGQADSAAWF